MKTLKKRHKDLQNCLIVHPHFQHWEKRMIVKSSSVLLSKWYIVSLHKETGFLLSSPFSNPCIWPFSCSNGAFNLDNVYMYTCICDFRKCGAACICGFLKCGMVRKHHRIPALHYHSLREGESEKKLSERHTWRRQTLPGPRYKHICFVC